MKINTRISSSELGDFHPTTKHEGQHSLRPDQIPSVSSSNGRPTCSQNSRAFFGGSGRTFTKRDQQSHGGIQNQGTLRCTSFAKETKHICMRYATFLSWIPSCRVITVLDPEHNTLHYMTLYYKTLDCTILPYLSLHHNCAMHCITLRYIAPD